MKKKVGDIMYNGLLADVFEDVFCPDTPAPSGHWLNEKVYIYDCLSESTEKEKDAIIVASYGTFSTGINIRAINNIVFASPSKSRVRVLQSIGRGLRQTEDKTMVRLFDVSDNLTYKSRQNFTYRHFIQRLNIYKEEQFKYEINRINL